MTSNESAEKSGYVQSVKIIDVEKRYRSGPKHYASDLILASALNIAVS